MLTLASALLLFETPRGVRFNVSSLTSPHFAHTYSLGSIGLVDGSLSYLYSSLPFKHTARSSAIDLRDVVEGYRHVRELQKPEEIWSPSKWERALAGRKGGLKVHGSCRSEADIAVDTLCYGRLYLPKPSLEALYIRRISPRTQLKLTCVSHADMIQGASLLALLQRDVGKHCMEYLYSTDSALLGLRGLYNFGPDPRKLSNDQVAPEYLQGRFSAGAEMYYGVLNKTAGMSTGLRFTTLPRHTGFPYTMTATLNPLMGNLSSTYAVKAGRNVALCSQFDFNFYSYESDLRLGCEIWRKREKEGVEWAEKMMKSPGWKESSLQPDEDVSGVLKARWDQNWNIGLLWEGRFKELLFSAGVSLDLQKREQIFRVVGVDIQYSS